MKKSGEILPILLKISSEYDFIPIITSECEVSNLVQLSLALIVKIRSRKVCGWEHIIADPLPERLVSLVMHCDSH